MTPMLFAGWDIEFVCEAETPEPLLEEVKDSGLQDDQSVIREQYSHLQVEEPI